MASIYTHQSANIWKTYLLMAVFLVVIGAVGYYFSYYYGNPGIFYFAIIFSLVMNGTSFWYSDKIALAVSKARSATREEFFDFYTVTENLSISAGLPMPRLFVIDDPAPNAFATGRDGAHSAVAATTGLLQKLDRSELEGVIAHELSHIGNRDILLMSVVVVLVGMLAILSDMFTRSLWFGGGRRDDNKSGGALAIVGLILVVLSPIIATLIKLAISRRREFLADASAAFLTRYPEGLANALRKISAYSAPLKSANSATAHLFIANPFGSGGKKFSDFFQTHPPVEERVKALLGMV